MLGLVYCLHSALETRYVIEAAQSGILYIYIDIAHHCMMPRVTISTAYQRLQVASRGPAVELMLKQVNRVYEHQQKYLSFFQHMCHISPDRESQSSWH